MKNGIPNRSLLPYLNRSFTAPYLTIRFLTEEPASSAGALVPFLLVNDSDPLTHIVEADFFSEAGCEAKKVFLFRQNDRYTVPKNAWWPSDNKQIEGAWEKAFVFYSQGNRGHSVITLGDRVDHEGHWVPFRSLFFCKSKQTFFEPPCPFCGRLLEQCDNDDVLGEKGLPAYSSSLNRYLFCPSCSGSGRESAFYTYERKRSEPALVKDWQALVEDFAALIQQGDDLEAFPCGQCSDRTTCYAAKGTVISQIVPFAFYPFFMIIFEGMPFNGLDFLALVSGASTARQPKHAREDKAVCGILKSIMERWERDDRTGEGLSEEAEKPSEPSRQKKEEPSREAEDAVQRETVILSPEHPLDEKAPTPDEPAEMVLEETVVVSPGREPASGPPVLQTVDEEAVPETVVIAHGKGSARSVEGRSEAQTRTSAELGQIQAGSDSDETGQKKGKKDEDVLPETVVISPIDRKRHGGDKKT
jgi:hypothetical protein